MRVTIRFDSADTVQVRAMAVALHRAGLTGELRVGVEGPRHWGGRTPPLPANQAAVVLEVLAELVAEEISDAATAA